MKKIKVKVNKLPEGFHRMPDGTIMRDSDHKMATGGQSGYALQAKGGAQTIPAPDKSIRINSHLGPVPRALANLEAEKGEHVVTDLDNNGTPESYSIGGERHYNGGTPLNLPPKSFIFSDHKTMSIKGDKLKEFTNTSKKSMTPAQIAKMSKYDLSKDNEILKDPNADRLAVATAERNIQNKLVKLGQLAMHQEGKKGFENGIPDIALPYLMTQGVDPAEVDAFNQSVEMQEAEMPMAKYGLQTYQTQGQVGDPENPLLINRAELPYFNPDRNRDGRVSKREQEYYDNVVVPRLEQLQAEELGYGESSSVTIPGMQRGFLRRGTMPVTVSRSVGNLPAQREVKAPSVQLGEYADVLDYGTFEETFARPEFEPVKQAMYQKYKEDNPSDNITYDQFIGNFMKAQKDNRKIFEASRSGNYSSPWATVTANEWDRGTRNKYYNDAAAELGFDPMADEDIERFQSAYRILADMQSIPEYKDVLQDFDLKPIGKDDHQYLGKPISPVDKWYGNTTIGQIVRGRTRTDVPGEYEQDPADEQYNIDEKVISKRRPEFWAQDNINMLANLAQTDTYDLPYMTRFTGTPADPLFMSPERGIQATSEVFGKAIDTFGNMGTPQTYANMASALGAKAAATQANYDAQIQNQNVGIYNQFAASNADMLNRANMANEMANAKYQEGLATLHQGRRNFLNDKLAQTAKLAGTALTNRAKSDMINQLYPQFQHTPRLGGLGYFTGVPGQIGITPVDAMGNTYANIFNNQPKENTQDKKKKDDEEPTALTPQQIQAIVNAQAVAATMGVMPPYQGGGQIKMYHALRKFIE